MKYLDFDLCIWKVDDHYVAEVSDSPMGKSERAPIVWPFKEAHHDLLIKLELAVTRAHGFRNGPLMSTEEKELRQFGSAVFAAVFGSAPEISKLYADSLKRVEAEPDLALRLKLRVDPPELAALPWEYVYDAGEDRDAFLCLEENRPVVRFMQSRARDNFQVRGKLRVLGMIANTGGKLDIEKERHKIDKAFESVPRDQIDFRWVKGGSAQDLYELMQQGPWDIFHFIGHGGTDALVDSEEVKHTVGYLVMQNGEGGTEKVYASQLGQVLKMGRVRLAVLNCCDSGAGFASLGSSLVRSSVPLAVAMQFPISDEAASVFSGEFYKSLTKGESVERALTEARAFMRFKSNLEWGIPVLFTGVQPISMFNTTATSPSPASAPLASPPAAAPASSMQWNVRPSEPQAGPPLPSVEHPPGLTQAEEEFRQLWGRA